LLDPINFQGKEVVEVGPASGFLTFEMEKRGANVISVELGPGSDWDYVKHHDQPGDDERKRFEAQLDEIQNSYWFAHRHFGSHAKVVYGTVYELPRLGVTGHVGVLANVLYICAIQQELSSACPRSFPRP